MKTLRAAFVSLVLAALGCGSLQAASAPPASPLPDPHAVVAPGAGSARNRPPPA